MTICVLVTDRADAGPLESVIAALPGCNVIDLRHVGGYPPAARAARCMKVTERDLPDDARCLVILGDRYEALAAAQVAALHRVPVCHIHGGETTTGALDNAFRHAITHIAEETGGWHFVATVSALGKVSDMTGYVEQSINPRLTVVGAPGLDGIPQNSARRDHNMLLATFMPETNAQDFGVGHLRRMFEEIRDSHLDVLFTGVNQDPGAEIIRAEIEAFCNEDPKHRAVCCGMTRETYIHWMQKCKACSGNSSSFLIESPWIGVPSVLYGNRQRGREMANTVFTRLSDALAWRGVAEPIYRGGGVGKKIAEIIVERFT